MVGKYTPEDLKTNFADPNEEQRLHSILDDLHQRGAAGTALSEVEKEFICMFIKNPYEAMPNFNADEICASFKFKYLYLVYGWDLTGGSKYYKPYGLETKEIPIPEAQQELKLLVEEGDQWGAKLADKVSADALMAAAIHEYEFELNQVNEQSPEFQSKFQFGGGRKYAHDVLGTRLRNKFIYLTAKEVFENFDEALRTLTLNGKKIIINEQSIVHITNRHFAELVKRHASTKSFHNENFNPKLLNGQLKQIFEQIEQAGGLKAASVQEVYFKFKNEVYKIFTNDRKSNNGDITLSTFFILEDPNQLKKLEDNFDLEVINNDLSVYQPKAPQAISN